MNGANFRLIGLTLLTAGAIAVGCGSDNEDDDDDGTTGTPTTGATSTTSPTTTTSQTQSATGSGTSNTTSPNNTGSSTTGAGGSGGACMDEGGATTGGGGEGGGAGEGGAPATADMGYLFVEPGEIEDWGIQAATTDCTNCADDGTLAWSCAVMEVSIDWPEAANTASHKFIIENLVEESELRDLSDRTVVASIRMTSPQVDNNGYDIDLGLNDFGDGSDWTYLGTCWSGDTACPEAQHNTELWADDPAWSTLSLPADAGGDDFDSSGVRKLALQISTKFWEDEDNPPTFNYDSAPVTFEVGMYVW